MLLGEEGWGKQKSGRLKGLGVVGVAGIGRGAVGGLAACLFRFLRGPQEGL